LANDLLETLQQLEPAALTAPVRQDLRRPHFEIRTWHAGPLSQQGIINPGGLFVFQGDGADEDGPRNWRIVLKVLTNPGRPLPLSDLWSWQRELLAMQSGPLSELPGPVWAPRCYGVAAAAPGGWIWMEFIGDSSPARWTVDQWAFAAEALGRLTGAYLTGTPLPQAPWLCRGHARTWTASFPPENAEGNAWAAQAFTARLRERVQQLWDEREAFCEAMDRLPQVFSHFDLNRRNMLIRRSPAGADELVLIDWAWCGLGPLGGDVASLVAHSALLFEFEPDELAGVEQAALTAHLGGLRAAGWAGPEVLVLLGYLAWFALFLGATAPGLLALWTSPDMQEAAQRQYGRGPEQLAADWARLCGQAVDRADEARRLIDRLG
jgi:hypothetical protein